MGSLKPFQNVRRQMPRRSLFDLSYSKKLTCDMGQLVPIMCDEMVPGDTFKIGNEAVVRFQPLVAPILDEVNMYVHYFFVPYRIIDTYWEKFITGDVNGDNAYVLPRWVPASAALTNPGTLWDYFGFPTVATLPTGTNQYPMVYPLWAYNKIFNEFYRDENLETEIASNDVNVKNRAWEKDFFTSALLSQQRGIAPALPITGTTSAVWAGAKIVMGAPGAAAGFSNTAGTPLLYVNGATTPEANAEAFFNNNTVNLGAASTFNVSDLRLAFSIQKWMERNNRCGVRHNEFIEAHFGVDPGDARLQRPEYIGGSRSPVIFSEVLQTSSTDATSPQGNMAGHGILADRNFIGKYTAKEFGLMMGIMSIVPKASYQQGIDKQWLRVTRYDFPFPEFVNLSEQAVLGEELYWDDNAVNNKAIFGYQGRYNECRAKRNITSGLFKTDLNFWHLGRSFASRPALNSSFVRIDPTTLKRIFAVPSEPGLMVSFGNLIRAVRPIPVYAEPGLIDHN